MVQTHQLPADFRFHDLRHYYASYLINKKLDIKTVQTRCGMWSGSRRPQSIRIANRGRTWMRRRGAALDGAMLGRSQAFAASCGKRVLSLRCLP